MNFSEQLKSQLDIVDVVQHYGVALKRQGSGPRYVGLCPFHSEKSPSFSVQSALGYYHCFGCSAGGDVFKFVQQMESLTFPETLKVLAERYGIPMPERQRSNDPETQRYAALLEMHEMAATLFQDNLRGGAGAEARRYLESRGVARDSIDEFRLGLSDASGQQLAQRLQRFGPELMEESGLIRKRDSGGYYDYFRGRLMFPIHNEAGKTIGFGGRALRAEDEPKYLNSPGTKLYDKKAVLYNLHRAKIDARKQERMVLVEGYMDVIGIYASGIHEVVSVSGTALGHEQVRAIKRQISQRQASTGQIVLNLDSDRAGATATEKHIMPLLAEGLRVKVLEIPGGLDPDEYIQQNGADAYRKLLDGAGSYFHWLADRARSNFDMGTAEGRMDAFKFLWPTLQQVNDKLERSVIASELAEYLNIDREEIRRQFSRSPSASAARRPLDVSSTVPPNEKLLLACLLSSAGAREAVRHYRASADFPGQLELRSVFDGILQFDEKKSAFSLDAILTTLEPRLQRILTEISFAEMGIREEGSAEQALHCLSALEEKAVSTRRESLRLQIRELEQSGKFDEAFRLYDELNRMQKRALGA
jgi:DNA primase